MGEEACEFISRVAATPAAIATFSELTGQTGAEARDKAESCLGFKTRLSQSGRVEAATGGANRAEAENSLRQKAKEAATEAGDGRGTGRRLGDGMGRARPAASASRYGTRLTPAPPSLTPSFFLSENRSRTQPRARINRNGLSPPAAPLATRTSNAPGPLARWLPPSWCWNAPASVSGRSLKDLTHRGCPTHCLMRESVDVLPAPGTTSRNS